MAAWITKRIIKESYVIETNLNTIFAIPKALNSVDDLFVTIKSFEFNRFRTNFNLSAIKVTDTTYKIVDTTGNLKAGTICVIYMGG